MLWYVDNSVGSSGNGQTWATAWKNLSDISYASLTGGDTVYISGGASEQTYYETLNITKSGSYGLPITFAPGSGSPSPSGHDGIVIIDGGGSRSRGIDITGYSYITVNGLSGGTRKIRVTNAIGATAGGGQVHVQNSSYTYIDFLDVDNNVGAGIIFDNVDNSRIRGNDVRSGLVSVARQTDSIYMQYGNDNVCEYNYVVLANDDASNHNDCLQVTNQENRLTIRGNWLEWVAGRGNYQCQAFIIEDLSDWCYFYNNIVLGNSFNPSQAALFKEADPGGIYYCWNNIIISQSTEGVALYFGNCTNEEIGAIINNILYSYNDYCLQVPVTVTPASKINNNCLYREVGSYVSFVNGQKTWAQHQAAGYDTDGINSDPLYDEEDEYRSLSESPCIDQGQNLSGYFGIDRDENERPAGEAWDIGAYEYSAESPIKFCRVG